MTTSSLETKSATRRHVSARSIDAIGLTAVVVAAAFLSLALVTENHMGMGVFMGLFISCLIGSLVLFTASRSLVVKCPIVEAPQAERHPGQRSSTPGAESAAE